MRFKTQLRSQQSSGNRQFRELCPDQSQETLGGLSVRPGRNFHLFNQIRPHQWRRAKVREQRTSDKKTRRHLDNEDEIAG